MVKTLPANAGVARDWEKSPEVGNGNPLQYCCLENPMDREAWEATVHGFTQSWTWLGMHPGHVTRVGADSGLFGSCRGSGRLCARLWLCTLHSVSKLQWGRLGTYTCTAGRVGYRLLWWCRSITEGGVCSGLQAAVGTLSMDVLVHCFTLSPCVCILLWMSMPGIRLMGLVA